MDETVFKGAYYLLVDPLKLYHKLLMKLFGGQTRLCWLGGYHTYYFEMDGWSTKRGEAKVPVVPNGRPCLHNCFVGLVLPVAERHDCAEITHCLLLFCS